MKELKDFVKKLLNTMVKGVGAFSLFAFLPLLAVAMAAAACLYLCAVAVGFLLACLADEGNLSKFVFPRWSDRSRWIPQLKFD